MYFVLYRYSSTTQTKLVRNNGRIPTFTTAWAARRWRDAQHKAAGLRGTPDWYVREVTKLTKQHEIYE